MILLVVIYLAFIGLGIPDSLIGSAWPAIYKDLNIPVEGISCITLLVSGCTVLSSIFSTKALIKYGTHKVATVSTAITAVAILGFALSPGFWTLCLLSVPLGIGAGAVDAGLNNYIALHYKANHMNYLHCFYGVGVSCSPYLMSVALSGSHWRNGYVYAFFLQSFITLVLLFSYRLWKKDSGETEEVQAKELSLAQMVKIPKLLLSWLIMFTTNAIELVSGTWASLYMIETKGFSAASGALALTLYYAGLALGRFTSGLLSSKIGTWKRIYIALVILIIAIFLMMIPGVNALAVIGLFFIGFGNGSIYPNLMHLTPCNFGKDISQAVMGSQIATAYIGVMLAPPLFGFIGNRLGFGTFPLFIFVTYIVMLIAILAFIKMLKKEGKFDIKA